MLYYFKKGKNATETQKKICAVYGEVAVTEHIKSGLQSFLVLLIFWPNNPLLWGCLMHWKTFSSIPGLYPLDANSGRWPPPTTGSRYLRHTQNIQINKVIGENEKFVFYFMEKTKWTFWPTQYILTVKLQKNK